MIWPISKVIEIAEEYKGKLNHFVINFGRESVHLKCDEMADKVRWVQALKNCCELHSNPKDKTLTEAWPDPDKMLEEVMNDKGIDEIEEEEADKLFEKETKETETKLEELFDFSKVLENKRLKTFIDKISEDQRNRHIQMGFVKKTSGRPGSRRPEDRQRYSRDRVKSSKSDQRGQTQEYFA